MARDTNEAVRAAWTQDHGTFGHKVRAPVAVLYYKWRASSSAWCVRMREALAMRAADEEVAEG